jgi:hypothetical protein
MGSFWRPYLVMTFLSSGKKSEDSHGPSCLHAATGAAANIAELNNTRLWVIGQLGMVVKMKACTVDLAKQILRMLTVAAFVNVGPKAAKCQLEAVRSMAGVGEVASSVRSFAVARVSVLATDSLPCVSSRDVSTNAAGVGGSTTSSPMEKSVPAFQHPDAVLLSDVRF